MVGCPRYASQHPMSSGRYIFTARTSPPGSHMERRKYSFSAHSPDGRTATQFAEAYPSVSLGLEARQTIPKRRRTASSARSHGIWNRYRKLEMSSPWACSPKAMKPPKDGGPPNFVWSTVQHSVES